MFLHTHPVLALSCNLNDGHVIVDRADWNEARRRLTQCRPSDAAFYDYHPWNPSVVLATMQMTLATGLQKIRDQLARFSTPVSTLRKWSCAVVADGRLYINDTVAYVEKIETAAQASVRVQFADMRVARPISKLRLYFFDECDRLLGQQDFVARLAHDDRLEPSFNCHT